MSRPREWNWKAAVMGYCTALLLSMGLCLTLLRAMLPEQALWPALLLCAGFTLAFQLLFSLRMPRKWILPVIILGGLGAWGALGGGPVYLMIQLVKAAFLTLRGIPDAVLPYAAAARWTICLLFSLLAAALAWDDTLPLTIFSVVMIIGIAFVFSPREELLLCALPAAAGLVLMMAGDQRKRLSVLPVAALLALGAFFLMPLKPQTVPALEKFATSIRQFMEDYLFFNEFRTSFSLVSEGFQPLEDRLGGQAVPENHTVMEVTADRTLLMRGRAYNEYSGLNWFDTLSARRYLYISPRFTSLRDEIFDLKRPLAGDGGVMPQTAHVHMLSDGPTTLFAPLRTRTLQTESDRMVLYYNLASELFLTRDFAAGDSYTLTYLPYAPGNAETAAAIAENAQIYDARYDEVAESYLLLPRHIQKEIFDIAAQATADAQTPYEKALALQNYLRSNYRYNLNVKTPPDGVDFVAWFLIGEKEGYCTYFATAMTVLCRIVGLPARYVTGYLAVPDENGVAVVTGKEAHAWTEVYFNGFGWLDFDATPRSDNNRGDPDDGGNPPPPQNPSVPPAPSPSPSPSPEPQRENTPTPEPEAAPSETPSGASPDETPTPEPEAAPSPPPDEPPSENNAPRFPWWLILAFLLLGGLLAFRYLRTEPLRRAARQPQQAADILFHAICELCALRGLRHLPQETLHDFAAQADASLIQANLPALTPLADAYAAQVYGRHAAAPAPFRQAYLTFRAAASPGARFRLAVRRMLRVCA